MHFCTAEIRLSGDMRNTVARGLHNPVSWPEIEVLRALHGHDAVLNPKPFIHVNQTAKGEKERLRLIYGNAVIEDIFPGRNPQMELDAPNAKIDAVPGRWKNPLDPQEDTMPPPPPPEPTTERPRRAVNLPN